MYEHYYGLSSKPFQLNPDPGFYYASSQHRRAKAYLDYGLVRSEGFIVITGEVGAGKTTVLRALLDSLNRNNVVVGHIVTTQLDAEDTLRMVGAAFGFRVKDLPKSELLVTLEAFLLGQTTQGKRCLLIVDEAQNLSPRALEELRMLSNFQLGNLALLQSFLVGQPEFRDVLRRPEMEQFRQRVTATSHIGPLDAAETQAYIEHRLKCAGSTGKPSFEAGVFDLVFSASQGLPRRINTVCDRLLLLGYLAGRTHLTLADTRDVVRELAQEGAVPAAPAELPADAPPPMPDPVPAPAPDPAPPPAAAPDPRPGPVQLTLDARTAENLAAELGADADDHGERLLRIERSLLRLERAQKQTLATLRQLLAAVSAPRPPGEGDA